MITQRQSTIIIYYVTVDAWRIFRAIILVMILLQVKKLINSKHKYPGASAYLKYEILHGDRLIVQYYRY